MTVAQIAISRVIMVAGVSFVLLAAGCGTRVERAAPEVPRVGSAEPTVGVSPGRAIQNASSAPNTSPGGSTTARADDPTTLHQNEARSDGTAFERAGTNPQIPPLGRSAAATASGAGAGAANPASTPPAPTPALTSAVPSPAGGARKSPILLASVGTISGPAGSTLLPLLQGVQLWVKDVNQTGGVNGHEIKLIAYDDGGDSARHRSQVQDAVENKHVIGFLANGETLTGRGSVGYINEKQVPVIGTDGGYTWAYDSPMYFPQQSAVEPSWYTWVAAAAGQAIARGKTRIGSVACTEVAACDEVQRTYVRYAKSLGVEHVYGAKASLAQPDFTAECLAAQNAGVELLVIGMDSNSVSRIAASCARQGYRPIYNPWVSVTLDRFKDDPNLKDDLVSGFNVFPWFQSGTPATDEFQAAVRNYGANLQLGEGTATGWVAGKLLERAAAQMPEPPTTSALLSGLWSIKGDNLGGLTAPLTFQENEPAQKTACWFNVALNNRKWGSPDQYKLNCKNWPVS